MPMNIPASTVTKVAALKAKKTGPAGSRAPRSPYTRPGFSSGTYSFAVARYNAKLSKAKRLDTADPDLKGHNLAVPHRVSYKFIRDRTRAFLEGKENVTTFTRWTDRFAKAADAKSVHGVALSSAEAHRFIADKLELHGYRADLITARQKRQKGKLSVSDLNEATVTFLKRANDFYANLSSLGPHKGSNLSVGRHFHLNVVNGSLTPMSEQAGSMTPRPGYHVAMAAPGRLKLTDGSSFPVAKLPPAQKRLIARHPIKLLR